MFTELWYKIAKTRVKQFPLATWQDCLAKAAKECQEILTAPRSKRPEEYADAIICIFNAASKDGFDANDIMTAMWYKDMVNDNRKFEIRSDGLYQHVPEE